MPLPSMENIARGVTSKLSGGATSPSVQAQTDRGNQMVKQVATGGLALGGGVGTAVALINYLRSLREEEEVNDESRLNDDTLYVPAPHQTKEAVNRFVAPGVAAAGGVLAAGGAYALTQAVYNYLQKKRRQSMLDDAQNETLAMSDQEIAKSAADAGGVNLTFADLVTAVPSATFLLAAMATGGVAYAALNKTFPTVKRPKSKYPKRIRQVSGDGAVSDLDPELMPKAASVRDMLGEADVEAAAEEFLMLITDQMAMEKKAEISLTSDIINRVASDGIAGAVDTYERGGLEALVESVKSASDTPASITEKTVAVALICKTASIRPVIASIAAAEFQDMAPGIQAAVQAQGVDHMDKMAGVAATMQLAFFRPHILEKSAMNMPALAELQQALADQTPEGIEEELTSDVGGSMVDDSEGGDEELETYLDASGNHQSAVVNDEINVGQEDPVDGFMQFEEEGGLPPLA